MPEILPETIEKAQVRKAQVRHTNRSVSGHRFSDAENRMSLKRHESVRENGCSDNQWNQLSEYPAPEGRLRLAQRFSAGKRGIVIQVPEGRPSSRAHYSAPHHPLAQSSHSRPLIRLNSLTLAVTSVNWWRRAWPAINTSYAPIGLPTASRLARTRPATLASSNSKGSRLTGPLMKVSTNSALDSPRALFPTPYQSSKATTAETKTLLFAATAFSKRMRIGGAVPLISAMQAFVSSRYIT